MDRKRKRKEVEWVGGTALLPAYVTGDAGPYRPEGLFWIGADGKILGSAVVEPGEIAGVATGSLRSTIEQPAHGRAHRPTRVRVASSELAGVLREAFPAIDIVCAPTPEMDELAASMGAHLDEQGGPAPSYLADDIGPDAVAALFRAMASLHRAAPWTVVPGDACIAVTIEGLDLREAALCVIGQMGDSIGMLLFSGIDDFEEFAVGAEEIERGGEPSLPPCFAINFDPDEGFPRELREEIARHGWELAGPNANPWVVAADDELVARPPTAHEVTMAEAISLALPRLVADEELLHAWRGRGQVERTITVRTFAGELDVKLRVPYEAPREARAPSDVLAQLFDLDNGGDELDSEMRHELEDDLMEAFASSPEAAAVRNRGWCRFVMDTAADDFGATIATLEPSELREIVFEIIPRDVSIEAAAAREIVEELRAFYAFLAREVELVHARGSLDVLGGDAVETLEAALGDDRNFGMTKSLIMEGRAAGFDMGSREGVEAWLRVVESRSLPVSNALPAGARRASDRAKKNRRKAERRARKKNRRRS